MRILHFLRMLFLMQNSEKYDMILTENIKEEIPWKKNFWI